MIFALVCFALSLTAGTAGTVAVLSASPRPTQPCAACRPPKPLRRTDRRLTVLHEKLWLTILAWLGIVLLPALIGSLYVPDVVERLRARNERILREREERANHG